MGAVRCCAACARRWVAIGHVAVETSSVIVAARVAARVPRTRQEGVIDGVRYVCLARWRAACVPRGTS